MVEQYGEETIDGIVALITETVCTGNKTIVVAGDRFPAGYVADRLASVTSGHVQYVLNALKENKTDVRNIKKYTLAALFNAPVTIDGYYDALARRDAYHRRE